MLFCYRSGDRTIPLLNKTLVFTVAMDADFKKKIKLGPSNKRKPVQLELKCDIPSSVLFLNRFECTL